MKAIFSVCSGVFCGCMIFAVLVFETAYRRLTHDGREVSLSGLRRLSGVRAHGLLEPDGPQFDQHVGRTARSSEAIPAND
jgi:hypothetical protein